MNSSKLDSIRLTLTLPNWIVTHKTHNKGVDVRVFCHTYNVLQNKRAENRFFV